MVVFRAYPGPIPTALKNVQHRNKKQRAQRQERRFKMKKTSQEKTDSLNEANISHVVELGWRD